MAPERPMSEEEKEAAFKKMFAPIDALVEHHQREQAQQAQQADGQQS